jgi:hypothetical protein
MRQIQEDALIAIAERWEARARRKFADAERENDPMGRWLIEHGATCLVNCAIEIRAIQDASCLRPSTIPAKGRRTPTSRV